MVSSQTVYQNSCPAEHRQQQYVAEQTNRTPCSKARGVRTAQRAPAMDSAGSTAPGPGGACADQVVPGSQELLRREHLLGQSTTQPSALLLKRCSTERRHAARQHVRQASSCASLCAGHDLIIIMPRAHDTSQHHSQDAVLGRTPFSLNADSVRSGITVSTAPLNTVWMACRTSDIACCGFMVPAGCTQRKAECASFPSE